MELDAILLLVGIGLCIVGPFIRPLDDGSDWSWSCGLLEGTTFLGKICFIIGALLILASRFADT
ncbi:MAG: hypothetical protein ACYSU0_05560 [Planctomycetota bacterium]|jgi:hypothetical protein